jgi:pentatricopeptide repeat protein
MWARAEGSISTNATGECANELFYFCGGAKYLYASMLRDYMIPAKLEHYTCMVHLLGHAGHLQEAENIIKAMPCTPSVAAWMALLGACRIHGNVEMAECVAK